MNQANQDGIIVAGDTAAVANSRPPPYLKLIADCWEHIFDYLSADDIYVMGQTCMRMHRMAGYYFREYLFEYKFEKLGEYICLDSIDIISTDFCQYIVDLELNSFTDTQMGYVQNVLTNVEKIQMIFCKIYENTYEQLANYCPKLKHLAVICNKMTDPGFDTLFLQSYPELEYLRYSSDEDSKPINELKTFLEKHDKLKYFGSDIDLLWANRDLLYKTNIRMNMLGVICGDETILSTKIIDFLKRLYERGFYRKWHLWYSEEQDRNFDHLRNAIRSLPILEKLTVKTIDILPSLPMLKELELYGSDVQHDVRDLEILAKGLIKLERLIVSHGSIDVISPFIRHSQRLRTIKVIHPRDRTLDLFSVNEERKKLANARCILLYLPERIYLQEKWKSKNLNLSHIEFRRSDYY